MSLQDDIRSSSTNEPLVHQYALALTKVGLKRGATPAEMIGGLVTNLAILVKTSAPPEEWSEAARLISEEIRRQLSN